MILRLELLPGPLNSCRSAFTGVCSSGRASAVATPVPIREFLGHTVGPFARTLAAVQVPKSLPLTVALGNLKTIFLTGADSVPSTVESFAPRSSETAQG